jgi:DNA polymerase-3 subunit alpha
MLEALIFSGALDILKVDRATLNANIEIALKEAQQKHFDDLRGQESLFAVTQTQFLKVDLKVVEPWLELEQLKKEKEVLGFYFSRHPVDIYDDIAAALKLQTPTQLSFRKNRQGRLIGLLEMVNYRNLQKGQMAHITLEDGKTQIPIVIFSKQLSNCSENLIVNKVVVIEGQVRKDFRGDWQVVASNVDLIETIKLKRAKSLLIVLDETQQKQFKTIVNTLKSHQGNCPVQFDYQTKKTQGSLFLSSDWNVKPDDELLNSLNNLLSKKVIKVNY